MDFGIRFAIVFQEDGLDKDAVRADLSSIAKIVEESDGTIESIHGKIVPLWAYILEGSLADFTKIKLRYNCERDGWYLFPREPQETRSIFVSES